MEHPLENGFAFLNPYGLPYLPGSSVKGVLRRAAEELSENKQAGWNAEIVNTLFGKEDSNDASRGALTFWDAIPEITAMGMDVMTPHYSDYYQGTSSPHDAGQPNPIVFMVIPPGSKFTFHVTADARRVINIPEWHSLVRIAFDHAFDWLGFGAKTAVGYGAMNKLSDEEIEKARSEAEATSLRCDWVDETIQLLAKKNNVPESRIGDVLRGRSLAEEWAALTDEHLKARALADIRARWQKEGYWDAPSGAARKAKEIYCG